MIGAPANDAVRIPDFPRFSQNSRQMTPRILRRAREFPRIFRESRRLEHTHTAEAWCVLHRSPVRDPLNPRACPSEAYAGELMPGNIPDHSPIHTQVICARIRLALKSPLPRSWPLLASLPAISCLFPAFLFVPPVRLASPAVRPVRQPLRFCSRQPLRFRILAISQSHSLPR